MSIKCPHCGKTIYFGARFKSKRERSQYIRMIGHKSELELALYLEKLGWVCLVTSTPISSHPFAPDLIARNSDGREFYFEVKTTWNASSFTVSKKQITSLLKHRDEFPLFPIRKAFVAIKFNLFNRWVFKEVNEPKTFTIHPDDESDTPFKSIIIPSIKNWKKYVSLWKRKKKVYEALKIFELETQTEEYIQDQHYQELLSKLDLIDRQMEALFL
jgi:Holliday junction resolvase